VEAAEVAERLAAARVPWYVAGDWALDTLAGRNTPGVRQGHPWLAAL
jgi:hypothetical protein